MNDIEKNQQTKFPWKGMIQLILIVPLMLAVLLLSAGKWNWWEAWAYTGFGLLILLGSRIVILLKYPDLAQERSSAPDKEDTKQWDKFLMPFTALYGPLISWIVAGLDVRFGWSPNLPDWIQIIALVVLQIGSLLGIWAMFSNRFFSSQVRIQTDRGHTVVREGPYKYVRHPGYAGGLISWLAAPVFFSSWWVLIPAVGVAAASFRRTALEDRTLQEELPGYAEYSQEVKYRLIPGIW